MRKAADLTLKTLSKVKSFVTVLAAVILCAYVFTYKCLAPCPGLHLHVRIHRFGGPENCGGAVAHAAGKGHRQQCLGGPLPQVRSLSVFLCDLDLVLTMMQRMLHVCHENAQ